MKLNLNGNIFSQTHGLCEHCFFNFSQFFIQLPQIHSIQRMQKHSKLILT